MSSSIIKLFINFTPIVFQAFHPKISQDSPSLLAEKTLLMSSTSCNWLKRICREDFLLSSGPNGLAKWGRSMGDQWEMAK